MPTLISVEKALCRIGRHGVLKIDRFEIATGQHWCLFGPNGAGKTLLANLIAGKRVESPKYVRYIDHFDVLRDIHIVSFEEQQRLWQRDNRFDISEFSENAQDSGTVVEQLVRSVRTAENQDESLLDDLITQLDLRPVLKKGIRFLSSGQIRKVLIARVLYADRELTPKLLILDDPLESIDKDSQQHITLCIEQFIGTNCSSLQLCRRQQDILPGVTHMALMAELKLIEQGPVRQVMQGASFKSMVARKSLVAKNIPARIVEEGEVDDYAGPLIKLDNVTASYGELLVLNNIQWTMEQDHHVLIEGPNGCGKSTLLSLIDGENHKGYGQDVFLFGRRKGSGETVWDIKARFGVVSNELHNKYVKGWKVLDVAVSGFFDSIGLYDDSGAAERDLARRWLETLGIKDLERHYYHEISFGQQRLVLLARAMVKHPRVLILDEPCVGLDDDHRQLILQTLDVIADQVNTNIVYVSHVVGEQPGCINQKLSFIECDGGGFTLMLNSD